MFSFSIVLDNHVHNLKLPPMAATASTGARVLAQALKLLRVKTHAQFFNIVNCLLKEECGP